MLLIADIESINTKLKKYRYTISSMWIEVFKFKYKL